MFLAQAQQQPALGGQAHAIAALAKVVAVRRDEPDFAVGAGDAPVARRPAGGLGGRDQLERLGEIAAKGGEVRADIDSADELGQLAESFDAMAGRIDRLVGTLEQRVTERTADLTEANVLLRDTNEALAREIEERKRAEEEARRLAHALVEHRASEEDVSSGYAVQEAVRAGAGIGFMSKWEVARHDGLVEVMEPQEDWAGPIWLVTHVDLHRTTKVQKFLQFLKDSVKDWD